MPHPRPAKPSVTLVHTTFGDLVQVTGLDEAGRSATGASLALREGEVVQCLRNDVDGVLVARADGTRVLVCLGTARAIGIRWFPETLEIEEPKEARAGGRDIPVEIGVPASTLPSAPSRRSTGRPEGLTPIRLQVAAPRTE